MSRETVGKIFLIRVLIGLAGVILFAYGCSNPVAHIPEFNVKDSAVAPKARSSIRCSQVTR
jgi:hypothetical protein